MLVVQDTHTHEAPWRRQLRKFAFKVINSTTILLPAWKATLKELGLPVRLLKRDVWTRWNSTYDMLELALNSRQAIDKMCSDKTNGLQTYELVSSEWKIVEELLSVLKVCTFLIGIY